MRIYYFAVILLFVLQNSAAADLPTTSSGNFVTGKNGMVSSRSALASQVGANILAAGGNAIDAAVATGFALAVTYPSAGNIGGGGLAVVHLANGEVVSLDHRERAPGTAHRDMFLDQNQQIIPGLSRKSHKASGVPGSVDGLLVLLEKYGTFNRSQVMTPAIELAKEGFVLTKDLVRQFNRALKSMQNYPASLKKFTHNKERYKAGDTWRQADLAKTLQLIKEHGRDGFYDGPVADNIVAEMQKGGGIISHDDLMNYRSIWRNPVRSDYRGYTIWGMPPPSSGGILVAQILNMLEAFDLRSMGHGSAAAIHVMVEAERRAYADRATHLGDSDYYEVPLEQLISKTYALQRFKDFNPNKASLSSDIGAGSWPDESPQTTHFSVLDKHGNGVSFTTTLNSSYGSKIVVTGTGILMNNEMDDFSIKENSANQYGLLGKNANSIDPGKRMLSSMSPTIVTKNAKPFLLTGSPGGSTIITTVLQVIVNVIDHDMTIEKAVAAPRFHHQWLPDSIVYGENGIAKPVMDELTKMGHINIKPIFWGKTIGDANSLLYNETSGEIHGVKDPRNEGAAVGF